MNVTSDPDVAVEREILRPLWKIHILHHAAETPIVGHWMMEELREHGYKVSPGTLYPMLSRMVRLGWLSEATPGRGATKTYKLTRAGARVLQKVRDRLAELQAEVFQLRQQRAAKRVGPA